MNPNSQWDELSIFLDKEVMSSAGQGLGIWQVSWTTERSMEVLLEKFAEVENHFITQIEQAIETWCATGMGDWTETHESVTELIRLRLEVAATFTHLLKIGPMNRSATVIPYPALPNTQVIRWLLIDWWNEHGRQMACDLWIINKWETEEE